MSTHAGTPPSTNDGLRAMEQSNYHVASYPSPPRGRTRRKPFVGVGRGENLPAGVGLRVAVPQGSDEVGEAIDGPPLLILGRVWLDLIGTLSLNDGLGGTRCFYPHQQGAMVTTSHQGEEGE